MSEEEEGLPPDLKEFSTRLFDDMSSEEKLLSAAQRGHGSIVKDLLMQGTQVVADEVCHLLHIHIFPPPSLHINASSHLCHYFLILSFDLEAQLAFLFQQIKR